MLFLESTACIGESGAGWTSGYVGPPLIFFIVTGALFYPSILKRPLVVSLSTKKFPGDSMRYVSCMSWFLILSTKSDLLKISVAM